jgi:hypothetical protein
MNYFGVNENENTAYQNVQGTTKAMFRRKFIALKLILENWKSLK